MSRPLGKLLGSAADRLFTLSSEKPEIAPLAAMLGTLVAYVAADADDHVANCLTTAREIRSLLDRARGVMPVEKLAGIEPALAWHPTEPRDFRGERIDQYVATLRRALIVVHAWLESAEADPHEALLDDVWAFLKADAAQASRLVTNLW